MDESRPSHPWPADVAEARAIQEELRERVVREDRLGRMDAAPGGAAATGRADATAVPGETDAGDLLDAIDLVAGVDVGFEDGGQVTRAAVAVLTFPGLEPRDRAVARRETTFPYVPGYLSFREIPAILDAWARLEAAPDVVLCDAHGYAHPRRCGLASHLGILLGIPSVGVAKSRLVGEHDEPGPTKGDWTPLVDEGERVGAVVRTRTRVKPVFVSVGHRVRLETAIELTLRCTTRYKLPETTRAAHRLASG